MPIPVGPYCQYCVDETGKLQTFEQRYERMLAWQTRQRPHAARAELERGTLAYMAAMPAWQDHPRIRAEFPDMKPTPRPER
jgi:hypothetical protein